jgi:putative membrane-bound dehydrogenase-like protein
VTPANRPRRSVPPFLWFLAIALLLPAAAVVSQRAGPPYSPERALETFRIADGFQVELFAAEPLISDPVAMEIDEGGRMYVVEMHGYPLDLGGSGRVMMLDDADHDGRPDRSTVFAGGLRLPTGIMRWKAGVVVTDSPDVWYLEDTNGDGRADIKRQMLTGFALSNPQHTTNTPLYGLDNWIYLANEGPVRTIRYRELFGDEGSDVRFPDRPGGPRLPPDADGRNVRFRPDTHELEMLSAHSQFGQTFDAWGHHFLITNNRHMYQEVVPARYLSRNPALVVPTVVEQLPDYRQPAELFPITESPEFQLLTDVGVMTAACGLTYYLADLFPPAYQHAAFVAEGAHNLVHVASVRDHGVTFRASRMHDGREFLASTDSWFRPVNFYLGPDGALYLIDYYRKILEHPEWLDDATAKSPDLYAGRDRGRIYRIVPSGTSAAAWLNRIPLEKAPVEQLVRTLAHPNIWWRRHAQRLLVDRKAAAAVAPLLRLAATGDSAVGRVHALWTLEGLGRLDASAIARALTDEAAGVRENAIKLAELHLRHDPSLANSLVRMDGDPDPKVRYQLLLTLGDIDNASAEAIRRRFLFDNVEDEWMQIAALSAPKWDLAELFRIAVERATDRETPGRHTLFNRLGAMVGAGENPSRTSNVVRQVTASAGSSGAWWRAATLEGLASGLRSRKERSGVPDAELQTLMTTALHGDAPSVRRAALELLEAAGLSKGMANGPLLQEAERLMSDPAADAVARADAVRLLALTGVANYEPRLLAVLDHADATPVQVAAVRALADLRGERIGRTFLELWDRWTPAVREEAVRALVREPGRIRLLLDAVAAGKVKTTEIERPLRIRLMMNDDDALRGRARTLFSDSSPSEKEAVARYRPASVLPGDPAHGREVFARTCSVCHQYRGAGGAAFGPDLGEVRGRLPFALIVDILNPNHAIADGYELWIVELTDGSTTTGVIGAETPTSITFRRPGGSETTISRAQISAMRIANLSAMPEGLESQIDLQQMADLIAYIKGGT